MIDWSKPRPLSKVTEEAGFTMSDVAFVSGLDESTVSRLWDDPSWLDRVSGKSLQSLAASVPGVPARVLLPRSLLGTQQNHALESLYATHGDRALLKNPDQLFAASIEMTPG